jgi:hypothetical protein
VLLTAKATLFWQLEDSFPLLSAEERDCIYNKSYIVYSQQEKETQFTATSVPFTGTTAHFSAAAGDVINRKSKIHLWQQECYYLWQQLEVPIAAGFTARVVIS